MTAGTTQRRALSRMSQMYRWCLQYHVTPMNGWHHPSGDALSHCPKCTAGADSTTLHTMTTGTTHQATLSRLSQQRPGSCLQHHVTPMTAGTTIKATLSRLPQMYRWCLQHHVAPMTAGTTPKGDALSPVPNVPLVLTVPRYTNDCWHHP
jgi:site-specific recombinase XerD